MRGKWLGLALAGLTLAAVGAVPAIAQDSGGVDETALPVGETVTAPTVGGLWACQTDFAGGPGTQTEPAWLNGDGTWDATKKYVVDGEVEWPQASFTVTKDTDSRNFTTNDLPTDHTTGAFPVASTDDAALADQNPNSIQEQSVTFELPLKPTAAAEPSCVGGEVGILKSGVLVFSSIDALGRDALAYETQDSCNGHPQNVGLYHYHSVSACVIANLDSGSGHSKLVGWALDGFGIYGPRGTDGEELTAADLDECHGHEHKVKFDGKKQKIYHYHATVDYPYTVGCYHGTNAVNGPIGGGGQAGAPAGGPPPGG